MVPALLVLLSVQQQSGLQPPDGIKKGSKAPVFKLDYIREEKQFDLAATIANGKPTVVVFGSYT